MQILGEKNVSKKEKKIGEVKGDGRGGKWHWMVWGIWSGLYLCRGVSSQLTRGLPNTDYWHCQPIQWMVLLEHCLKQGHQRWGNAKENTEYMTETEIPRWAADYQLQITRIANTNTMNGPPPARPPKVKQSMLRKIQWHKQKCHKSLRVTIMVSLALPTPPGASRGNCFLWVELSDHTWVMC